MRSRYSLLGANATVLTSAACPSTWELGLLEFSLRVSQLISVSNVRRAHTYIMSFLSSPTDPNM